MISTLPGFELIQSEHDGTGRLLMGGAVLRRSGSGTTLFPESEIYLQPASDLLSELLATWSWLEKEGRFIGAAEEENFRRKVSFHLDAYFNT